MPHDVVLCFGRYRLAGPYGPLWHEAQVIPLQPKALTGLWLLASQAGHLVSKATLLDPQEGTCDRTSFALSN